MIVASPTPEVRDLRTLRQTDQSDWLGTTMIQEAVRVKRVLRTANLG